MSHKRHAKVNAAGHIRGQQGLLFLRLTEGLSPKEILIVPIEVAKKVHLCAFRPGLVQSRFSTHRLPIRRQVLPR